MASTGADSSKDIQLAQLTNTIRGVESGGDPNAVSPQGASGSMQIMPGTFKQYALPGEDYNNDQHRTAAAQRKLADDFKFFGGDIKKTAAAYIGGRGAVLSDGTIRSDVKDAHGTTPAAYADNVVAKMLGGKAPRQSTDMNTLFDPKDPTGVPNRDYNLSSMQRNGASPSEKIAYENEQAKAKAKTSMYDNLAVGAETAVSNDMSVVNWWKSRTVDAVPDPNFTKDSAFVEKMSEGVDPKYMPYIYNNAISLEHAQQLKQRAVEFAAMDKKYEEAGFSAGVSRIAVGMLSPDNIALMGLTMVAPELGVPMAASKFGRIAAGAAEGAVGNIVLEAAGNKYRPDAAPSDLAFAGAMGVAFGGIGGAFSKNFHERIRRGQETMFDNDLADIHNWSLDQLHEFNSIDYANERMRPDYVKYQQMSPEERQFETLRYMQEYDAIVQQRKNDTLHGTGDFRPPQVVDGEPKAPFKKTWDDEWDTPAYQKYGGGREILQLPPKQPLESLIEYTRLHSKDKAMVAWMDRMLDGIDLNNVKRFEVGSGKKPQWYIDSAQLGKNAGHVVTPWDSLGTKAGGVMELILQGKGKVWDSSTGKYVRKYLAKGANEVGSTGLTDHVLVHELVHVSTAYKIRLVSKDKNLLRRKRANENIAGDARTIEATKGLDDLYKFVMKKMGKAEAKKYYGMTDTDEFVAEGISNPVFQKALRAIILDGKVKRTNVMTKFLDHIMDVLGIDKSEQTAFHRFLELAEPLTEPGGISLKSKVSPAPADGFRIMPNAAADADTIMAAEQIRIPEVFGWGIGLENRTQKMTLPQAARALSQKLLGSTIGYKGNHVVEDNAWDATLMARDGWNSQLRKGTVIPFLQFEKQQGYKFHERGQAYEDFGEQVWKNVVGFEGDYDPLVIKAADAVRKNMADRVEYINNPARDVGGQMRGLTEREVTLADGSTTLTGKLEQNPFYMPRVHDANKWANMVATHGYDKVESFWASAYRSGREGEVSIEDAKQFAKWYTKTVDNAKSNQGANQRLSDMLRGQDKGALLDSLRAALPDMTPEELTKFSDQIMGVGKDDKGRIVGNLKHRNTINERYVGAKGSDIEGFSLADFVRTNALEISQSYNNRVAGNVALARTLGVYTTGDISSQIDKALKDNFSSPFRKSDLDGARKDFQFIFDRILGVPQVEGFSAVDKSLEMFRDFNVVRLMSGAVYNQLAETAQMTGTVGYKALLDSIPELKNISRDMLTGKAPSEFLDHMENTFGGAGAEYMNRLDFTSSTSWGDQYGKGSFQGKYLDPLSTAFKKMASGTLDYTGMTGLMVQQKRLHVTALANGFVDLANGIDNGGGAFLTKERLAWMGLSEKDFGDLKGVLKSLSSEGEGSIKKTINQIDWDKFQSEHTELHHKFSRALMRESRRVIQENDLGSMVPWMGTTMGKTMGQFMNFSINAWNKQLMFGLNHADLASANTMFQGILLGSLVYSSRMYQQSIGMEEQERQKFLEDRLSPAKVVANGWSRTGASSMLPNIASTVLPAGMGGDLFSGGRTTSDLSGIMAMPTVGLINTAISLGKKTAVKATSSDEQFTQSDVKALFKLMPYQNLIGVNTVINKFTSDLPISSKQGEQ